MNPCFSILYTYPLAKNSTRRNSPLARFSIRWIHMTNSSTCNRELDWMWWFLLSNHVTCLENDVYLKICVSHTESDLFQVWKSENFFLDVWNSVNSSFFIFQFVPHMSIKLNLIKRMDDWLPIERCKSYDNRIVQSLLKFTKMHSETKFTS